MKLEHVTYKGKEEANFDCIKFEVPAALKSLLEQINGFIQYHGGLHVRGICRQPEWHSLNEVMTGKFALHKVYENIKETDLVFAQDCMADQFFIRDDCVYKLYSESGEVEFKESSLNLFLEKSTGDPVDYLEMQPLLQFQTDGNTLDPGSVLHAVPPFCTEQSENGVHLGAIPIHEAMLVLPDMARVVSNLNENKGHTPFKKR